MAEIGYTGVVMAKTLVDIEERLLTGIQEILGTTTKKTTIIAALQAVIDRKARHDAFDALDSMELLKEAAQPGFRENAWGRHGFLRIRSVTPRGRRYRHFRCA